MGAHRLVMLPSISAQCVRAVLLYAVAYLYCIHFATYTADKSRCAAEWCERATTVHERCIVGCGRACDGARRWRGQHYIIGADEASNARASRDCLITFWGMTHFLFYALLGFAAPSLFWPTAAVGVAFELYEAARFDCHDALDVVLNSAGFVVGSSLARACGATQ